MTEGVLTRDGKLMTERESKYHYYKKTFLFSAVIACLITVPFIIYEWVQTGHGIYLYYGDYEAQQLAFYRHCVDMVRSGNIRWDWYTDMGSNFVGSYSYYMLGSPFFWLMCLFPSSWTLYLMGPVYILKYITAAMTSYAYLQRWTKNKDYAVLGALLYSFCGFQIYNTFFNQFHEVVAFFPLLLLGMEEYIQNKRKGLFAVAVCLNAMINYFMFAGQVVFCVIYFLFRFSDRSFRVTLKNFFGLVFEAVLGFAMSMVLFLPGALALLGNDRTSNTISSLKNFAFWWKSGELYWQRYGQILESYFFPPDIPSRVNFFYGHTERWASISAYLPMFGMTGVFALFTTKRRNWLKGICIFLVVCSFVPGLNSMFFLGNSSYYARWMYMMVLMFVVGTVIALDSKESRWKVPLSVSLIAITAIAVPLGLLWYDDPSTDTTDFQLGRAPFPDRFWIYVGIALVGIFAVWYLIKHYRGTPMFTRALLTATAGCIVLYSCVHIINGKQHSRDSVYMVDTVIMGEDVVLPSAEEEFYRIDFYRTNNLSTIDNLGIYWHYPTIECFHTVVPPSIMNFYDLLDYNRAVGSRTLSSWYGFRALTSTEYSFIETSKNKRQTATVTEDSWESIEQIAEYEESSKWTCLESADSVRVFRCGDAIAEIRLYNTEDLVYYESSSVWECVESTEEYRTYAKPASESAEGETEMTYKTVYLHNTEELQSYADDPDWEYVKDVIGYRNYSREEFNIDRGWTYYDTQNGYDIYHNDNYITMGFSYDGFMTESEFKKISGGFQRSVLLCTYLVVPDDMADYYSQFMTEYVDTNSKEAIAEGKSARKAANYTVFRQSVEERRSMTCTDFAWSSEGFSAKYSSDETDIVFFSVPAEGSWYHSSDSAVMNALTSTGGWTATVNGREVEILTVFDGFMAVEVPAGDNEIVFTYKTFGGGLGLGISLTALAVFILYMTVLYVRKKHRADYRFFAESYYEEGDVNLPSKKERAAQMAAQISEETAEPAEPEPDIPIEDENREE